MHVNMFVQICLTRKPLETGATFEDFVLLWVMLHVEMYTQTFETIERSLTGVATKKINTRKSMSLG